MGRQQPAPRFTGAGNLAQCAIMPNNFSRLDISTPLHG